MDWLHRIAEERIQKAIEEGIFDDLPRGKPLRLDANPFVPAELRVAYKMLKDAGFLPPEMELRREIVTLKELLATLGDDQEAERSRLAGEINERVIRLNLMMKRSFTNEDRQVYAGKIRKKLGGRSR